MKSILIQQKLLGGLIALSVVLCAQPLHAAVTDLATVPLANATAITVLPNIMFIQDDSGSMDGDFMPDYVSSNYCRDNYTEDGDTNDALDTCKAGDAPYFASAFNGVYYNPLVDYTPPANADGSSKTSYNSAALWGVVPKDGYGVQFTGTTNLLTGYPERVACNLSSPNPAQLNDTTKCKSQLDAANTYLYPDATYKYMSYKNGAPFYYTVSVEWCRQRNATGPDKNFGQAGDCQAKKTSTYKYVRYYNWSRKNIVSANAPFPGANGSTRTYDQEMTNFANWYAWYRTRMQMAKTSIGLSFKDVRGTPNPADATDSNYFHARVGLTAISEKGTTDGAKFLAINDFNGNDASTQKGKFYSRLYALNPGTYTPLRGALAKAGKIYAGVLGADPIQYSCQRNFAIMTTDGYWNTNEEVTGTGASSYGPDKIDGSDVGDQDGAATKPSWDKLGKANTLADVAYYYYHTDLRPGMADEVTPVGTNPDVDDVSKQQHMTTFTVGLGVDGTLNYQSGYKTSITGDYYDIVQGTKWWPDPIANTADERIDDLWHAAVNGRGTYFSARDPAALQDGIKTALGNMGSGPGSGAAAATSNLEPTPGDNGIYIAKYRTFNWDGELNAYSIDLSTGAISATSSWEASALLQTKISPTGNSDTRTIYIDEGGIFKQFTYANLSATEKAYFNSAFQNAPAGLNQYSEWSADQKAAATGDTLVNYLRGQFNYENQDGATQKLYRDREKVLGDIVHSQPIYVKAPPYSFADTGYATFKSSNASRLPTLYAAGNDGMLHAFDTENGTERWAYVPPMVMPNLWRLADEEYGNNHRFYLDGPLISTDAYIGGSWKTILIGGMGAGGRGYYAVDVTNPTSPLPMWNFTVNEKENLGYSYGVPFVTKLADGTWVAVVTSGYNNVSPGDGKGHVFVLNLADGSVLKDIDTGVGSTTNPSGLARLNVVINNFSLDNTAVAAYGGDLYGNMWRFDLDAGTASKLADFGSNKPIMAAPEVGDIDGDRVVFFGTGRYLGQSDLSTTGTQSIYGIKDDGSTTISSTSNLVGQTVDVGGAISKNPVDWSTKFGWFVDLPVAGERVAIDLQLYFGTLTVATVIPAATECLSSGTSRLYQLDYKTGGYVGDVATAGYTEFTSPIVGLTVVKLPTGTPVVYPVTADGQKPNPTILKFGPSGSTLGTKRVLWRELTN